MENNCLVTKLTANVNDNSLLKIGEMRLEAGTFTETYGKRINFTTYPQVIETLEAFSKALDLNFERTGKPFDFQSFSTNFDDYRTGAYTPSSQQQLMKHININTVAPDKRNIEEALKRGAR